VLNEGFYELFSLLEKQKDSCLYIRCHTFNTRVNRLAIFCFVIYPMQVLDGHISTFLMTLVFYSVLVNNCLPVIYCSTFVQCFCSVIRIQLYCSLFGKIFSPDPGMCSRYFDPHKNNNHLASQ
jgi:hypothetical protein